MNKSSKAICIGVMSLFLVQSAQANPFVVWGPRILKAINIVGAGLMISDAVRAQSIETEDDLIYRSCKKEVYSLNEDEVPMDRETLVRVCVKHMKNEIQNAR